MLVPRGWVRPFPRTTGPHLRGAAERPAHAIPPASLHIAQRNSLVGPTSAIWIQCVPRRVARAARPTAARVRPGRLRRLRHCLSRRRPLDRPLPLRDPARGTIQPQSRMRGRGHRAHFIILASRALHHTASRVLRHTRIARTSSHSHRALFTIPASHALHPARIARTSSYSHRAHVMLLASRASSCAHRARVTLLASRARHPTRIARTSSYSHRAHAILRASLHPTRIARTSSYSHRA